MNNRIRAIEFRRKRGLLSTLIITMVLGTAGYAQIWGPDVRLTNDGSLSYTTGYNHRCVAASGDTVHIVWIDTRAGNHRVYYKRSLDNGENWYADDLLTDSVDADAYYPSVAAWGSNVHLVWTDERTGNTETYYKRSTDNGAAWGNDVRLTNDPAESRQGVIAAWDMNVHALWSDSRIAPYDIYYKRSTNSGTNWDVDRRLTTASAASVIPAVAASQDNLHVVWQDDRDADEAIYYKRSTNNGDTWDDDLRLSDSGSVATLPSIAAQGDNLHLVWEDSRNGFRRVYYKRSLDNGGAWGNDIPLTPDSIPAGHALDPSVAVSGSHVHVVWSSFADGVWEIYYRRSTDNGTTWEDPIRLTNNAAQSESPSVAAYSYNIHVVWTDERDGNQEIYYKHGLSGQLQPDNLIKNNYASVYLGDGIYNSDGTNQVAEQAVKQADTSVYYIRIENDGDIPEEIFVGGSLDSTGWSVTYYDSLQGGVNINPLIEYSMWSTGELEPGDYVDIRVEVIPSLTVPEDSSYELLITSTSSIDTIKVDAVKAITTATENPAVEEFDDLPAVYSLEVFPNSEWPLIRYNLPRSTRFEIKISDVTGRTVRTLTSDAKNQGSYSINWDVLDDRGVRVPEGIYFCTLKAEDCSMATRFLLLR